MDDELSFCRMVLIDNRNDCIPSCRIHLVSSVAVHLDFYIIGILGIAIRGHYFLDPVVSAFKSTWQDQITIFISKIRFMGNGTWIGGRLLHIFSFIQVVNLKLGVCNQDRLLGFIILFNDF